MTRYSAIWWTLFQFSVKGLIHWASGDVIAGQRCLIFSTIVSVVLVVGYFALQYGGVLIAICAGVGAVVIMRGLTTAVMSNGIPSQPQRNLHAIRNENLMINADLRIIYVGLGVIPNAGYLLDRED